MSPREIDQLFTSPPEEEASRTEALRQVESTASNLWDASPDSPDLRLLAQKAGDAAREERWRTPLGASGLLAFFCRLLVAAKDLPPLLATHALRVIGNSCADRDENRERVVASGCLPKIVALLDDESLLAIAIPVLFNICVDYEPAQKALYKAGINPALVNIISSPRLENASSVVSIMCRLLVIVAPQEPEEDLVDPTTPFALLSLATQPEYPVDPEDFLGLTSVALMYLFKQQFQQTFLQTPNAINLAFQAFSRICGNGDFDISQADADDREEIKQVQLAFVQTFAELSANDLFASLCPLNGPEAQALQEWISTPKPLLQSAACLVLGNIARADEICTSLVQQSRTHEPLITLLSEPSNDIDPQLLHSVLSFLKNLAIPAENKTILADAGLLEPQVLPRIWGFDMQPQIQFDAASLVRMLLVNCLENVRRICSPLAPDHDQSGIQLLMDLHARADQEPTKMETARAVAMVCRVLHSTPPPSDTSGADEKSPSSWLQEFYDSHPAVASTMLYLGLQEKFPALRSDFLFVFALMARSPQGAQVAARSMQDSRLVAMLVKAITGQEFSGGAEAVINNGGEPGAPTEEGLSGEGSAQNPNPSLFPSDDNAIMSLGLEGLNLRGPQAPDQANNPPGQSRAIDSGGSPNVDRANGLVLIAELLARCPAELPPLVRTTFTRIFQTEGKGLSNERSNIEE